MAKKLRIGILIQSHTIPAWSYKMLERIVLNENLQFVLVVNDINTVDKSESFLDNGRKYGNQLLWILFSKIDNVLFNPQPDAFEPKNIKDIVNCQSLIVQTEKLNDVDSFKTEDIFKIKQYDIDVLINLCYVNLKGAILSTPRCGIWSYCHGDRLVNRGGAPGAREVIKNQDKLAVILEILSEKSDGGLRLATSYSAIDKLSVKRTRNSSYWKGLSLLPRKLEELHRLGQFEFLKKVNNENSNPEFFDNRVSSNPSNIEVFFALLRISLTKTMATLLNSFYFGQWILVYKFEKRNEWSTLFYEFKRIVPPKDRFWADPFIWLNNGKYYIFLEELIYKNKIGKIAVLEIDEDGNYGSPQIVLDKPYHLSYPFLIEDKGELFMIPETAGNRTIEIYRCVDFPLKWVLHKVLMKDVYAVDSTILRHNGKYWLFCNIRENDGASSLDELFLFYSDSLLNDDWKSHLCNPVVSDVSQSRPAGNIFKSNGKIYRPSQNSTKGYGHGMKINEIIDLTTTSYRENTVQTIDPNWEKDLLSTHTINHLNKLTIIDALIRVRK